MDLTPRPASQMPSRLPPGGEGDHRSSRAALGARGEDLAARFLVESGMVLLARNWRIADGELRGELDLILREGDTLVVAEVKTRRGLAFGSPLEAVTPRKQAKVRQLAAAFARESRVRARNLRCDVVGVLVEDDQVTVTHVPGAF